MRSARFVAVLACLFAGPLSAQTAKPDQASIDFIGRLRNSDGGYAPALDGTGKRTRSSLRATTAAMRALKYLGSSPPKPAEVCQFIGKCFDPATGGFGDFPGEPPNVPTTAVGVMAAVELGLPPETYREAAIRYLGDRVKTPDEIRIAAAAFESLHQRPPKADEWLKRITPTRNVDGAFGAGDDLARATGGTAAMILRLAGELDHREAVIHAMRTGQRADGGFGSAERPVSDLESTYRVMRAFAMLKDRPTDPGKLRSFVDKCRSPSGGYAVMPGQPPTAAGTYYATIILHWLEQP